MTEQLTAIFRVKKPKTELRSSVLTIGARSDCDLRLADPLAASIHCTIEYREGAFLLSDAGTAGGTFVDGRLVDEPTPLADGQEIVVGTSRIGIAIEGNAMTLSPNVGGFHFVKAGRVGSDPDHWVKSELRAGWNLPVRVANRLAVVGGLALLVAVVFWNWFGERLLDPGPLSRTHCAWARTVGTVSDSDQGRIAQCARLAEGRGCQVCHEPGQGTTMSKCATCHERMMEDQHPFVRPGHEAALSLRIMVDESFCRYCHVDHRGAEGLLEGARDFAADCENCHTTEPEIPDFRAGEGDDPPGYPTYERNFARVAFSHATHVQDPIAVPCEVCHVRAEQSEPDCQIPPPIVREFSDVPFETCKRCHVVSRDGEGETVDSRSGDWIPENRRADWLPHLLQWLPDLEQSRSGGPPAVWVVEWHGQSAEHCQACHVGPDEGSDGVVLSDQRSASSPLNSVLRADYDRDAYLAQRARYTVAVREHSGEFRQHGEADCNRCHENPTVANRPEKREGRVFWHASHTPMTNLFPGNADEQAMASENCLTCHDDLEAAGSLLSAERGVYSRRSGGSSTASVPTPCAECHKDGDNAPLALEPEPPQSLPATVPRPDFPHDVHLGIQGGCFRCHEFLSDPETDYSVTPVTRPDARDCRTCHAGHENVGGNGCKGCHPPLGEKWHEFWCGSDAIAVRGDPPRAPVRDLPPSTFDHFSVGHRDSDCRACHDAALPSGETLSASESIESIPIPTEDAVVCRDCHLKPGGRFHWR